MSDRPIRLVVSDVDGTLVNEDKALTDATVAAVAALAEQQIAFAVTSGRPPRGMAMLVDPLGLSTPIGGFNGGQVVDTAMAVLEQHCLPDEVVEPMIALLGGHGLDVWLYQGTDWVVTDLHGPHVEREVFTCGFDPVLVDYV